jgi:hypothetical protein
LSQALHLSNSDGMAKMMKNESNVLAEVLTKEDRAAVEALYLRAYSRPPTEEQWRKLEAFLTAEREAGRPRRRAFENLLLVLINSKEFQVNR